MHREIESYERLTLACVFTGGKVISVDVPGGCGVSVISEQLSGQSPLGSPALTI